MCGILALISRDSIDTAALAAATAAVRHRGPDDEGYVLLADGMDPLMLGGEDTQGGAVVTRLAPGVVHAGARAGGGWSAALGHRRLSIIDLSTGGHQPMCTADRRCWITYNGEVYNYLELRDELRALGFTFTSESDTEVILASYRAWGPKCLERFNGMFAFVIVDLAARRVFAARDRFGVKPLYYWFSPQGMIALASEIKQFSMLPGWRAVLNGQRAYDFLNWGLFDHSDETLFDGVFQLRGGEAVTLDLDRLAVTPRGRLPTSRWYELRPGRFGGSLEEAGAEFRRLLTDSVRLRLRADVSVGSCLSGGLDSSAIVCLANSLLRQSGSSARQKTFTAGAATKELDEREFAEEVVRATGVDAHYVEPGADQLFDMLGRMTWHQDEPFGSTSVYAQWQVFRLAAENGIKVMLDGQGADEQLAGYHSFFSPHFGVLLRGPRWLALRRELTAAREMHGYSLVWGLQQVLNNILPEPLRQPLRRLAGRAAARARWLDLERLGAAAHDPFLLAGNAKARSVREMSLAQVTATSLPMLLHWEDRNSMAHSVEARVPFLDYRLVEFVLGLPDVYKLEGGVTKRVLREAMRGVLPEKVRTRMDKIGFATAEEDWLRTQQPGAFRSAMREAVDAGGGVLRREALDLLEQVIDGRRAFSFLPWRLISFGAWMRRFDVKLGSAG